MTQRRFEQRRPVPPNWPSSPIIESSPGGFRARTVGWLTKLSDPIVIYNPDEMLGLRMPWDIPVEDFGFGFAMVTLAILLWRRWCENHGDAEGED